MKIKKNKNKGFTLVELLVVIAIIGVLAVVAVPSLFKQIDKSRAAKVEANYSAIKSAVEIIYTENGTLDVELAPEDNSDEDNVIPAIKLDDLSANNTTDNISRYLEIEGLEVGDQTYTIDVTGANTATLSVTGLTQNVARTLVDSDRTIDGTNATNGKVVFSLMN